MRKLGPAGRRFRGADDSLTREADFEASAPDSRVLLHSMSVASPHHP